MAIEIIHYENQYGVKLPREAGIVQESLKDAIPSVRFCYEDKTWRVGPRCLQKLEHWCKEAEPLLIGHEEMQGAGITDEELSKIRKAVQDARYTMEMRKERIVSEREGLQKELAQIKSESEAFESAVNKLNGHQDKINALKKQLKEEKALRDKRSKEAQEIVGSVCDLDGIVAATKVMRKYHDGVGTDAKRRFDEAKEVMAKANENLKKIGYFSPGLEDLALMNFNKPGRDDPRKYNFSDICKLVEYGK